MKKPISRRALVLAALAATLVLAIAVLRPPAGDAVAERPPAAPRPALTVTTTTPESRPLPLRIAANGDIAAWQEASIGAGVGDQRLLEVLVNVGDRVRAGQLLARFDEDTLRADVAQARAALLEAEAAAAEAQANAERARNLRSGGAMSEQQVVQYLTAERTTQARIAAARATLAAQEVRLAHARVVAPDHGVISSRSATVGAVVGAGAELFRMIRQGRLEWRAELTAAEMARVRVGTPVRLTLPDGSEAGGKVRMLAPTVDPRTRSGLAYVDLAAAESAQAGAGPRAGMFARGEFELGASTGLTLPQQAVVVREAFSYVFRVGEDDRVSQIKIQTGRRVGDRVEVVDGLPADARVVVAGAGFLNEGDLVRVAEAPADPR
ncbi:efflux RND transporter periplasmic adaptor subunit [Azoarcus olearius]|uniref:Membrane fusion protein n=1 Tax=Azoarcus sp. (strain BH72) TaxID=418699 RepID=A1K3J5_AZOSB|nr:efflux RND transporter periplasmic adaptor subunit [Azoarcus olearius]CAL93400.1 membrane fusion protein [Azoarcus olearius]